MNICIFCSAARLEDKYTEPAVELSRLIGERGHTFVWGGTRKGLMETVADSARKAGARLVGISTERFKDLSYPDLDEMHMLKTLAERKAMMLERSDAMIALVGGIGTLDEFTEVLELKKHGAHGKPLVVLNSGNFYEGLKVQLQKMQDDGFLPMPYEELIFFADTPEEAISHIEKKA